MDSRSEQAIALKLESIPIPDLADAIWARIEAELDIDLPSGESGNQPPSPSSGLGFLPWGLSLFVMALLTAFFFFRKPSKKIQQPSTNITTVHNNDTTSSMPIQTGQPAFTQDSRDKNSSPPVAGQVRDSSGGEALTSFPFPAQDTASTTSIGTNVALPPPKIDSTPQKKRRGVPGLKDEDYRIVPKKDSTGG